MPWTPSTRSACCRRHLRRARRDRARLSRARLSAAPRLAVARHRVPRADGGPGDGCAAPPTRGVARGAPLDRRHAARHRRRHAGRLRRAGARHLRMAPHRASHGLPVARLPPAAPQRAAHRHPRLGAVPSLRDAGADRAADIRHRDRAGPRAGGGGAGRLPHRVQRHVPALERAHAAVGRLHHPAAGGALRASPSRLPLLQLRRSVGHRHGVRHVPQSAPVPGRMRVRGRCRAAPRRHAGPTRRQRAVVRRRQPRRASSRTRTRSGP